MPSAPELVTGLATLASLPAVYLRIREELDAPDGSLTAVATAISGDPATTARLLHVVNSAFYGYGRPIETAERAVVLLGLQQVHDLVLAMSLGATFAQLDPAHVDLSRFWRGSVMRGLAARAIGRACGLPSAERLFVIGLLSDLGHLVMYQAAPDAASASRAASEESGERLHDAERRIVGCDSAEVGAALMERWKLPGAFAQITGAQFNPRLGGEHAYEAAIVHVAAHLAAADLNGDTAETALAGIDPVIWSQLDMAPEALAKVREDAELNLAAYVALFFPELH
ncbi:MAG: HDOD domain-containing protein [Aromatoleum sp.]|jgi:HD-like signal output (HDOD) protein|uniref:HDOD domain-containing protein n=1 Tax=Aromatoleum sp. TaxID=2307007 RepID=UPI00289575FB|nr:HDOD domain-containing protein [Aromatoleum sp.]MDT3671844.1 HDOD domain-containing protein [Aromatoleum sp.]